MSQHVVVHGLKKVDGKWLDIKWVFGWDQPLLSFYLREHNALVKNPDENPVLWLGATADTKMYEVEDLVKAAKERGLDIPYSMQVKLYGEKDDGI